MKIKTTIWVTMWNQEGGMMDEFVDERMPVVFGDI